MDGMHFTSADLMSLSKRPDVEWCGASCHNAEELFQARQLEMDFAVLAPVLPTSSHPDSPALGWRKFAQLIHGSSIPVYALGGLRSEDLAIAWEHGAHGIALMRRIGQVRGSGQKA
jgi:8-oxo-dGTP diphosphatase